MSNTPKRQLSTQPYRGAKDLYPEEMRLRRYIFDTWRKVAVLYGFEEYDIPILEPFELFAAKSGEELVNTQLFAFEDQGGRKLAIRPELTPSTTRIIAARYNALPRPIKWFTIGNNWRYEKPQLGRGRDFYQLEMNVFGVDDIIADWEIFQVMIAIMKEFGAKKEMFTLKYSDRKLITALLNDTLQLSSEIQIKVRNLMDKRSKMEQSAFIDTLVALELSTEAAKQINNFMSSTIASLSDVIPANILEANKGYQDIQKLDALLKESGLSDYCRFDPSIIRGFDYSDGLVYEVFDNNPKNSRSIFGGERFDGLVKIFDENMDLPSTGFAMGDWTLPEFLKNWNLIPPLPTTTRVLVTIFNEESRSATIKIVEQLRAAGISTEQFLEPTKLEKQLKYADKRGIPFTIIAGPNEIKEGKVLLKDLIKREQKTLTLEEAIAELKK